MSFLFYKNKRSKQNGQVILFDSRRIEMFLPRPGICQFTFFVIHLNE